MTSEQINRRELIKRFGAAGLALSVPGFLSSCGVIGGDDGGEGGADGAIKVGLLVPTSGVYTTLGEDMRNGFQLFLDENKGMLGGRKVEMVTEDEGETPEIALRKAQKLVRQDRVALVVGIVSSASALGLRDLFHEEQVPLVIANAGANGLTREAKSPYLFRTSFSNWQPNYAIGQWAYDNVATRNVYLLAPDYAAGLEMMEGFKEAFQGAGGTIAGEEYPAFGTTKDYQPFLSEVRNSGAEAVYAFFAGGEAITFVTQYAEFGLKDSVPLLGPGFLTDEGVLPSEAEAALGIRTSLHYTPQLDNPKNKSFSSAYQGAYEEVPTVYAVQAYDAAQLIDASLIAVDGDTSDVDAFVEAMANVGSIDSPRGEFEIDPETHNPIQPIYLREVKDDGGTLVNEAVEELGVMTDPG